MEKPLEEIVKQLAEDIGNIQYISSSDIPGVDLYMDQVTTFMEEQLASTKRHDDDKILTKTMINNYAKNDLLPSPVKKKYTKDHLILLTYIYYYKNLLSINDIQKLLAPMIEQFYDTDNSNATLTGLYDKIFHMCDGKREYFKESIARNFKIAQDAFADESEEINQEEEYLQLFAFICLLGQDVYGKLLLINKLIDLMPEATKKK